MFQLNSQDREIIEQAIEGRFWELIQKYIEKRKNDLKTGILSGLNEERSKSKRNDRDLVLTELVLLDEFLNIPNNLKTLISNETDISAEAETA